MATRMASLSRSLTSTLTTSRSPVTSSSQTRSSCCPARNPSGGPRSPRPGTMSAYRRTSSRFLKTARGSCLPRHHPNRRPHMRPLLLLLAAIGLLLSPALADDNPYNVVGIEPTYNYKGGLNEAVNMFNGNLNLS